MVCGPVEAAINCLYSSDPDTRLLVGAENVGFRRHSPTNYAVSGGAALSLNTLKKMFPLVRSIQSDGSVLLLLLFCSVWSISCFSRDIRFGV